MKRKKEYFGHIGLNKTTVGIYGVREQYTFQFENGYGASVVRNKDGYEVAVIADGTINYESPITNDVVKGLSDSDVKHILSRIRNLKPYISKYGFIEKDGTRYMDILPSYFKKIKDSNDAVDYLSKVFVIDLKESRSLRKMKIKVLRDVVWTFKDRFDRFPVIETE